MRVLVVTMTCGRLPVTRRWLGQLAASDPLPFRHVVVDNGSDDGTPAWLEANGYEVLANDHNVGIAAGWVQAWEWATADGWRPDLVVKYDDDCEVLTDAPLTRLVQFHDFTGGGHVLGPLDVEIQPGWEPRQLGPARTVEGWPVRPLTHVGGIFVAVPAAAFELMVEAGPIGGDVQRGNFWRRHGYPTLCLDGVRIAHRGLDAQTEDYRF